MEAGTPRGTQRGGNVLLVVVFLGLMIGCAFLSVTFLTRTDMVTNENLLREILATNLAESIAAQIEVQVNGRPWSHRFWLLAAQANGTVEPGSGIVPRAFLDQESPQVNLSRDTLPPGQYTFVGMVKDLPSTLREYRLYLEVTYEGETYAYSWDKRWELSLLAGLDRDNTQQDRIVEDPPDAGPLDDMLDTMKLRAVTAPPGDGSDEDQRRKLIELRDNEPSFRAYTVPGGPEREPGLRLRGGSSGSGGVTGRDGWGWGGGEAESGGAGTAVGDGATSGDRGTPAGDGATSGDRGTPAGDGATSGDTGTPVGDGSLDVTDVTTDAVQEVEP